MNKLIFLIAIGYATCSCSRNSKEGNTKISLRDTVQNNRPTRMDTTDIDAVKVSPDKFKILLENDRVRVIEYSLKPGEKDNTHTHPPKASHVISGGRLRVFAENEKPVDFEEVEGATEWSERRSRHYVENIGKTTVTILYTEIKCAHIEAIAPLESK